MKTIETYISSRWLKASVMGSVWAANEIILGSFLHNLRVPLSGTFMAFLSVALMVAFSMMWKDKGLIIRAGLVAALMKSISPSAIILGPMVGIFLEAFLLQLWVWILGRNPAGFMVGGAFAVGVVIFQKVGRLLISYGLDFLKILDNLYRYSVKQLDLHDVTTMQAVIVLVSFYAFWGVTGALIGWLAGRKAVAMQSETVSIKTDLKRGNLFEKTQKRKYSIPLLVVHFAVLITAMTLINHRYVLWAGLLSALYIAFVIYKYRNALRRLGKPGFWIWFVGITFLAAWFLDPAASGPVLSRQGLMAGLLMNLRAFLVMFSFAAISIELRNPVIKSVMFRNGAAALYRSLEVSFSVLPVITSLFPPARQLAKKPLAAMVGLLNKADSILEFVSGNYNHKTPVLIVTGEVQSGKTTFLTELAEKLEKRRLPAGGFITRVEYENGNRKGYYLIGIKEGGVVRLCSTDPATGSEKYGRFYFNKEAFERGRHILEKAQQNRDMVIIIDEIGPLEMTGSGWAQPLELLLESPDHVLVWSVRKSLAEKAARKWDTGTVAILNIGEPDAMIKALNFIQNHSNQKAPK